MSTTILSVRMSSRERELIEVAADQARTTVSDFVRRKAIEAAELDIISNPVVIIPAKDWEKFESWMDRPADERPELRRLLAKKPVWES